MKLLRQINSYKQKILKHINMYLATKTSSIIYISNKYTLIARLACGRSKYNIFLEMYQA